MKTLKTMMSVLLLVVTFAACKKDKVAPDDQTDPNNPNNPSTVQVVSKDDLLPYYIVAERKAGDNKLALIYFSKEGSSVKINLHRQGYLRSADVTMDNSSFNFDVDGTGNTVYNFTFEKSTTGSITLKSYSFVDKANTAQGINFAVLGTQAGAASYDGATFKSGDITFQFSAAKNIDWDIKTRQIGTRYLPPPINQTLPVLGVAPEVSVPYYGITAAGFKANNDFIGAVVPSWKDTTTPLLLVERNSVIYPSTRQ